MSDETPGGRYLCKTGQEVLASMTLALPGQLAECLIDRSGNGNHLQLSHNPPVVVAAPDAVPLPDRMIMKHPPGWIIDQSGNGHHIKCAVPDSPSETAVTDEHRKSLAWDKHADTIRRDRDAALEERDAERARAEAAEKELAEETRLREFWRDRCFAAEKEAGVAATDYLRIHAKMNAQIVRLMAERDEAQAKLAQFITPALLPVVTSSPDAAAVHNPFRSDFGRDRRRVGS